MNTTLQMITPEFALEVLTKNNQSNRRLKQSWVDRLARDMSNNAWVLTHQGIAFDETGTLLDGQHRLAAVVKAGRAVQMLVTVGVPCSHRVNGTTIKAFDAVDQGSQRQAGEILRMHGFANSNRLAAVCRTLLTCCTGQSAAISVPQIQMALDYVCESADVCITLAQSCDLFRPNSASIAAAVFLHTVDPARVESFLVDVSGIRGAERSPSRALVMWLRRHPARSGNFAISPFRATAYALRSHMAEETCYKVHSSDSARQWLLEQNKPLVEKFRGIVRAER